MATYRSSNCTVFDSPRPITNVSHIVVLLTELGRAWLKIRPPRVVDHIRGYPSRISRLESMRIGFEKFARLTEVLVTTREALLASRAKRQCPGGDLAYFVVTRVHGLVETQETALIPVCR